MYGFHVNWLMNSNNEYKFVFNRGSRPWMMSVAVKDEIVPFIR